MYIFEIYASSYLNYNIVIYSPHYLELIDALEHCTTKFYKNVTRIA